MTQDLSPMQQMIYTGQFGTASPMMQPTGFNPYANNQMQFSNAVPIGGTVYPVYQQQPTNMMNSGQVFQPIGGYQQQPKQDYFNPYGGTFAPYQQYQYQPYGNPYGYSYQPYAYNANPYGYGYNPFQQQYYNPMYQQKVIEEQNALMLFKCRVVDAYYGNTNAQDAYNKQREKTQQQGYDYEKMKDIQYQNFIDACHQAVVAPQQIETNSSRLARFLNNMIGDMHAQLDNHTLQQFMAEDFWRLKREEWIRENININANRNLAATYNSNDYNELLRMHMASNPMINELLDSSKYDNNVDDIIAGLELAQDRQRRRQAILEGKVPEYISSPEVQAQRHAYTNAIMEQIYKKGAKNV